MGQAATYRQVFAVRGYRYLFAAYLLSLLGDHLTAVTVAFLVYSSTGSAGLAAAAFASSYLAWLVGGPVLSGLADRYPRRTVMVACDLARAALVPLLALPVLPPGAVVALAFVVNLLRPPFVAARAALMPELLDGDRYPVANGLDNIVTQAAQVGGFAVGGALVVLVSPTGALLLDAATFVTSALLVLRGVPQSTVARPPAPARRPPFGAAARSLFGDPTLRAYLFLLWVTSAFACAAEGLAAPLAAQYGGGPRLVGLLLASGPLGMAVGGLAVTRLCPPGARPRLVPPLAVLAVLALVAATVAPPVPVLLGLLFLSGFGAAFAVPLNAMFGRAVPSAHRGRAFGVAITGLSGLQGLAMVLAGLAADRWVPTTVVGVTGMLGVLAVLASLTQWRAAERPRTGPNTSMPSGPPAALDRPEGTGAERARVGA